SPRDPGPKGSRDASDALASSLPGRSSFCPPAAEVTRRAPYRGLRAPRPPSTASGGRLALFSRAPGLAAPRSFGASGLAAPRLGRPEALLVPSTFGGGSRVGGPPRMAVLRERRPRQHAYRRLAAQAAP